MAKIYEITTEEEWQKLVDTAHERVMVEFYVPWCPHCQKEAPILESVAPWIAEAGIKLYHANAEVMWQKGDVYGLSETPSFILVEGRDLLASHEGFLTADEIKQFATQQGEWDPQNVVEDEVPEGAFCAISTQSDERSSNTFCSIK